jgi:glycosyltransferase involved in cell wall biosynthesis
MQIQDKNILYIGPYRQNDGWGLAAKDYIKALSMIANVHCQPLYLSANIDYSIDHHLSALENNVRPSYDIVIQHCLPMNMTKTSLYNIGLLFVENQNFFSDSVYNLNMMDEVWVSSQQEKNSLEAGGVTTKIFVIGHPIDTQKLTKQYHNRCFDHILDDHYKFYFIGEYIQRKNINTIIAAFNNEFDLTEKVKLVIKTNIPGATEKQAKDSITQNINAVKKSLRVKRKFHDEIIITSRLTDQDLLNLHYNCDCFITTSYGEAFCRPAAEAACCGNYIISSNNIGVLDYIDHTDRAIIKCIEDIVLLSNPDEMGSLDIYNAKETWLIPSAYDLSKLMRSAYENKAKAINKNKYIEVFSYRNISNNICHRYQ